MYTLPNSSALWLCFDRFAYVLCQSACAEQCSFHQMPHDALILCNLLICQATACYGSLAIAEKAVVGQGLASIFTHSGLTHSGLGYILQHMGKGESRCNLPGDCAMSGNRLAAG